MDNMRKTTDTLTKDGNQMIERVQDAAETTWEKGRATLKDLRGQGQEVIERAQKSSREAWEDAQKLLHKHPAKAAGLALVIGAVIGGALMAMRNND